MVEFTLDGRTVSAPEGKLLLRTARQDRDPGALPRREARPVWRLPVCVVSVEGAPRPLPACATRVAGMVVSTNGSVPQLQKTLTEMLLTEHLNPSPGGRPNELLDMAAGSAPESRSSCPTRGGAMRRPQRAEWATTRTRASSATAASAPRRR